MNRTYFLIFGALALALAGCSQLSNSVGTLQENRCQLCHGTPPESGTHLWVGHQAFIKNCGLCHAGYDTLTTNPATHDNGKVDTATVKKTDPRCFACHIGSGNAADGCRQCHALPPDSLTHAIVAHRSFIDSCGLCHAGYDSSHVNPATHRNGMLDTATFRTTNPTCTACHGIATGTGCNQCHSTPPTGALHATHVTVYKFDCNVCHPGNPTALSSTQKDSGPYHRNGTVDVSMTLPFASTAGLSAGTYDSATKTCSNVYCHGYFRLGDSASVKVSDTGKITCASCHDTAALLQNDHHNFVPHDSIANTSINSSRLVSNCAQCHPGYSMVNATTNLATHVNGTIEASGCNQCHAARAWSPTTPRGTVKLYCAACHDFATLLKHDHHDTPDSLIIPTVGCNMCHPGSNLADSTVSDTFHINGKIDTQNCSLCHEARVWTLP